MFWYFLLLYLSNFTYVHHHLHHIFHISPGSSLPSILSKPLPSLYMLPLDGCPSYSKDVDYRTQIYHVLIKRVIWISEEIAEVLASLDLLLNSPLLYLVG